MSDFEMESLLHIDKKALWKDIWNFTNINRELSPYVSMTPPDINLEEIDLGHLPLGQVLFSSTIWLFKILPVDRHQFSLHRVTEFHAFEEASTSLLMKRWNHTRQLKDLEGKTLLTDKITFKHRVPFLGRLSLPLYRAIFFNRHRYLKKKYNEQVSQ